jgi:hypothetical protein
MGTLDYGFVVLLGCVSNALLRKAVLCGTSQLLFRGLGFNSRYQQQMPCWQ